MTQLCSLLIEMVSGEKMASHHSKRQRPARHRAAMSNLVAAAEACSNVWIDIAIQTDTRVATGEGSAP